MIEIVLAVMMSLAIITITFVIIVEYLTSTNMSSDGELLAPCDITRHNSAYNLVFVAIPMSILMTGKLRVVWDAGAVGLLPVTEMIFTMTSYAMQQLWGQHIVAVVMSMLCASLQFLLLDICNQDILWRFTLYTCMQLFMALILCAYDPHSLFDAASSTFRSVVYIIMALISIWSNAIYLPEVVHPHQYNSTDVIMLDLIGGCIIWMLFACSVLLQYLNPDWIIWTIDRR